MNAGSACAREFDARADGAIAGRDPALLVESLDGASRSRCCRCASRRATSRAVSRRTLCIRVYPDDLHTIDHEPTPTANELAAAQAIWRARFAHDDAEAARLLRDLMAAHGRGRANWLVRVLTPTNPLPAAEDVVEPEFPASETIEALAKTTRAVLLPERFCAIGYAAGRREVFRVWGRTVPDELRAHARLAGDRQSREAAWRRTRMDGRFRRRARQRHGDRGHAAQQR